MIGFAEKTVLTFKSSLISLRTGVSNLSTEPTFLVLVTDRNDGSVRFFIIYNGSIIYAMQMLSFSPVAYFISPSCSTRDDRLSRGDRAGKASGPHHKRAASFLSHQGRRA